MCGPRFNFVGLSPWEKRDEFYFYIWNCRERKMEKLKGRTSRRSLVLFHIIQQIIHNICTKLQNPRCNNSWEILDTNFPYVLHWSERWEKGKRMQNKSQQFCFLTHNILGHYQGVHKIWRLTLIGAEKSVTENLIGEKEKWINKGNDKHQEAESLDAMQQVIPNICTKFQNPGRSSSWEIFDTNFPMYYIGVRDGKMEKEGKN